MRGPGGVRVDEPVPEGGVHVRLEAEARVQSGGKSDRRSCCAAFGGTQSEAALQRRQPTVLPFYHTGMGEVMPHRANHPSVGRRVHVLVGKPVELEDISCRCNRPGFDQKEVWAWLGSG